jgi:diguanylate cyclase (GGDEF)-like protein/PAS domain S-box-containing protein
MNSSVASFATPGATNPASTATSANDNWDIDGSDIAERKAFLELGAGDSERLGSLHALIEPAKNAFTEAFYGHILSFEPMRRLMPDDPSLAPLREAQSAYFSRLTAGDYGDEYVANRLRVGHVHQRIGLEPKWYIGAYRKYLSGLMPLIWEKCGGDAPRFLESFDSLLKVVLFDMGLALDSYFQAEHKNLQEMQEYADRVISTMPNGLLVLDAGLRLRTINPAAREMLGLDEHETLAGRELGQVVTGTNLPAVAREVLEKKQASRYLVLGSRGKLAGRILIANLSATLIDQTPALIVQLQDETENMQIEESLARFRAALDASDDAIYLIDHADMRFVDMNASACRQLGYSRQELLRMGPQDIQPEQAWGQCNQRCDEILATPSRSGRIETSYRRKNGKTFPVEVVLHGFRSEERDMLVAVARDISQRKRAEESLRLAQRALEATGNGIVITDPRQPDNPIVYVNPAFERITGYSQEEVLGRNCRFLHGEEHDQPGTRQLRQTIAAGQEARVVVRNYRKDGAPFWNELLVAPVRTEDGSISHFVGVQNDVTEQKRAEENLLHLATHDSLTGLPNRSLLQDRLCQALNHALRTGRQAAVLFIDVDRFKNINDSLGHSVGDLLISAVAQRLRGAVRKMDTVARVGGDEFVVVLTDVSRDSDIVQILPNLIGTIAEPIPVDGHVLQVTASIGISVHPRDGTDVTTLLKNADTAMYRAKDAGRNTFRFYAPEMNADAVDRLRLESDLRKAVSNNELLIHYQPQVEFESGRIVAAEALVRWRHPKKGLVSPGDFIPLAEETGLIVSIGEWVLNHVCAQVRAWRDAGGDHPKIAVNLSPRQFHQANLLDMIQQTLREHDLPAEMIELEITESTLMYNPEEASNLLGELNRRGFRLSVDDFGTGYSSLAYLKRFPLHALKIDRSFVQDIETNRDSAAIAAAVISLAHSLGLKVVAEGVETVNQMEFLRGLMCDIAQGYLHGRPMPAEELMAMLAGQP